MLIADDDPRDRFIIQKAISGAKIIPDTEVQIVKDGKEIVEYFKNKNFEKDQLPSLVMLDLNMKTLGGIETLKTIKKDPMLCNIPVVIFTTSETLADEEQCLAAGAHRLIRKPESYNQFIEVFKNLKKAFLHGPKPILQ